MQEAAETDALILNAFAAKFKLRTKDDFKGRRVEACLKVQAVSIASPNICGRS